MRIAMFTPLPPTRTGVAHYASMLLPALQKRVNITAFDSDEQRGAGFSRREYRRDDFDLAIYQLGNNPHHELAYREAMESPGIVVLHDVVLHHLIVEMTIARGDTEGYIEALRQNHVEAGAAWARGRAAGLHIEIGNFLFPASIEIARRSRAVIVHNDYAADRLRSFGVETPIHVVAHPYVPESTTIHPDRVRGRLGFPPDERVIGLFGFLTSAKRGEIVVEAFRRARQRDPHLRLRLLIVGEAAPNIDVSSLQGEGLAVTGYVSDEDFGAYYRATDALVNLRYPSAGETSGTLIRGFDAGKPVAVSDYAQFAELPDTCVTKIPLGEGEVEALERFFLSDFDVPKIAAAQRQWLEQNASLDQTVEGYLAALSDVGKLSGVRMPSSVGMPSSAGMPSSVAPPTSAALPPREAAEVPSTTLGAGSAPTLALFPSLELLSATRDDSQITLRLRNTGEQTLLTREYGSPGYRLIGRFLDGDRHIEDRWLALPGDLQAGEEASIDFMVTNRGPMTLQLFHALESVPHLEAEPWATVRLDLV